MKIESVPDSGLQSAKFPKLLRQINTGDVVIGTYFNRGTLSIYNPHTNRYLISESPSDYDEFHGTLVLHSDC